MDDIKMETKLLNLFENYKNKIEKTGFDEILHYYNNSEYEMALEGFLIEIISSNIIIDKYDILKIIDLGKYFKLDTDSVFDNEIWSKFNQYIQGDKT